jgi:F-type H+-transporting ATPase subunit a
LNNSTLNQNFFVVFEKEVFSPLDQFEIRDLLSIDLPILGNLHISITNIGFYLIIGAFFLLVLNLLSTNYNKVVSNK